MTNKQIADKLLHDMESGGCYWCGRGQPVKDYDEYFPEYLKEYEHANDCIIRIAAHRLLLNAGWQPKRKDLHE